MPIEQQPGNVEPETQVFAKITTEEPTVPAAPPAQAVPATQAVPAAQAPAVAPATPASARTAKSLTRRIARKILGPSLMTKK